MSPVDVNDLSELSKSDRHIVSFVFSIEKTIGLIFNCNISLSETSSFQLQYPPPNDDVLMKRISKDREPYPKLAKFRKFVWNDNSINR